MTSQRPNRDCEGQKTERYAYHDIQDFQGALCFVIQIKNSKLVAFGHDLQLKGISFRSVVAPEVVLIVV